MIEVKMFESKWRIGIVNELFEFQSEQEMKETLDKLIEFKSKFGKLKR